MQSKKMSFANLPGKLSKNEMKRIVAGGGETSVLCGTAKVLSCNCEANSQFYCCSNALSSCVVAAGCSATSYACVDR